MIRKEKWVEHLKAIYGDTPIATETAERMAQVLSKYEGTPAKDGKLSQRDSILITYGDTLRCEGEPGFQTLHRVLGRFVGDAISTVHFLPMFPYTSDDGLSVVDYRRIAPELGTWDDVRAMAKDYGLMFDAVVNHISKSSEWFQKYLACEAPYTDYFIT